MVKISMFITLEAGKEVICFIVEEIAEVKENVFSKSLLGIIIQDGGMREREDTLSYIRSHKCSETLIIRAFYWYTIRDIE